MSWLIAFVIYLFYPLHDSASDMLAASPLGLMIYWKWRGRA